MNTICPTYRPMLVAAALVAVIFWPAWANASDWAVSAKVGANWSWLKHPADPRGAPTLLRGAGFDGAGFVGGGSLHYRLADLGQAALEIEAGVLASHHNATGTEQIRRSAQQRDLELSATMIRVPVLAWLRTSPTATSFRFGVGIEAMVGVETGAQTEVDQSSAPLPQLATTATTHLGATFAVGVDLRADADVSVPIDLRATWDPFVAQRTQDRFEHFQSDQRHGEFKVDYNWQVFAMTGLRYEL